MFTDQLSLVVLDPLRMPSPGSSPFDDELVAIVPPMWRADRARHIPTSGGHDDGVPGASALVYFAAFGGTLLAGGLFPFVVMFVPALFSGRPISVVPELLGFALAGFLFGVVFAASAATCVFPLVVMLQWLAGLNRWRSALATAAGGWTGFAAVAAMGVGLREGDSWPTQFLVFGIVAMVMGQLGAGWAARKVVRAQHESRGWRAPPYETRFTLRQLLGLTAGVAIIAAILSALQLPTGTWIAMGVATAVQAATLGVYLLHKRGSGETIAAA
jgi:hypothetical protein